MFETLASWGSIEMQEALESTLESAGVKANIDQLLPTLRLFAFAMLVAAIAATVFAVFTAKGHQPSRVGLSALAVLAAMVSLFAGVAGLFMVAICGLILFLLWNEPARIWFAVVNGKVPLELKAQPSLGAMPPAGQSPDQAAPGVVHVAPPAFDPVAHVAASGAMPSPVRLALLIAGIGSLFGAALSGLVLAVLVGLRDEVVKQYENSPMLSEQLGAAGLNASQLVSLATGIFAMWLIVSVLSLGAVAWAATSKRSGWWALIVMMVITCGVAAVGLPLGLIWLIAAIAVIVQLTRPEAKAWFNRA